LELHQCCGQVTDTLFELTWKGIVVSVSIGSILFGVAISTAYYGIRRKYFSFTDIEINSLPVRNLPSAEKAISRPEMKIESAQWKSVSSSRDWGSN
jgi:hypothetical protein